MLLTMTEAAKRAGVSRARLYRDISNGKVSVVKDGEGPQRIDLVELARVYRPGGHQIRTGRTDRWTSGRTP